jgi:hypothetical protein
MPSTLEVIDELAFLSADISVLDFADCKLEYVEENAYGTTIHLPNSLYGINRNLINFRCVSVLEVDEYTATRKSELYSSIMSSYNLCKDESWLLMKVFRGNQLILEFVVSSEFQSFSNLIHLIEGNKVNFKLYDEWFDKIHNRQCRLKMAVCRLKWLTDLPTDIMKKYISFLDMDMLWKFGNSLSEGYRKRLEKTILPIHLKECFEDAVRENDGEKIAYWLEVINRNCGRLEKSLEL